MLFRETVFCEIATAMGFPQEPDVDRGFYLRWLHVCIGA
jgi:hypothetical protein